MICRHDHVVPRCTLISDGAWADFPLMRIDGWECRDCEKTWTPAEWAARESAIALGNEDPAIRRLA